MTLNITFGLFSLDSSKLALSLLKAKIINYRSKDNLSILGLSRFKINNDELLH